MQTITDNITISRATVEDMPLIVHLAEKFKLDTRDIKIENFLVAKEDGILLGFGRLKYHKEFTEMGTFAVLPAYRHRGVGQKLMNQLIKIAPEEVYLLTTIPEYGYRFGFRLVMKVPDFIKPHLLACIAANYPDKVSLLLRKPINTEVKPDINHCSL